MGQPRYGKVYTLYMVTGYQWESLEEIELINIREELFSKAWHGHPGQQFGFAGSQVNGEVYYGHFTQQYEQVVTNYKDPTQRETGVNYPFEDRFYLFVPKRNLFVLERRNFIRQAGLTPSGTERRIEKLIQDALVKYEVRLEKFSHELTIEQMREYFHLFPVVGLEVTGLRERRLPDNFIFFNPNFDKNAVSRELFNDKILPFTDSLDLYSDAYNDRRTEPVPSEDLRKNPLARLAAELSPDIREVAIHHPQQGRQYIRQRYDDTIRITVETGDKERLAVELVERVQEIPDVPREITFRVTRQAGLFDQGDR